MDGFVGLYPDSGLPSRPFLSFDGKTYLITHSAEGARLNVILIDTKEPCSVAHLTRRTTVSETEDPVAWSWNVLATDGQRSVLCWRSTSNDALELVLGILEGGSSSAKIRWQVLDKVDLPEKRALASIRATFTMR